jgi:hypothetical protein
MNKETSVRENGQAGVFTETGPGCLRRKRSRRLNADAFILIKGGF